jgi:Flp pilus assembly protein TadG
MNMRRALWQDECGAVFAEFAILLPVLVTIVCGSVDFLYAFYQWNAGAKALQVGARIAAVSDPVATGLRTLSNQAVLNGAAPGTIMPSFTVTCSKGFCTCVGTCGAMPEDSFDADAMKRIVYGRGSTSCGDATSYYTTGMCDVLPSITPENVVLVYSQTALGYAGRPGGPVPTITLSLQNMRFRFFFLSSLLGIDIAMPAMTTTITAEDLCSGASTAACGS